MSRTRTLRRPADSTSWVVCLTISDARSASGDEYQLERRRTGGALVPVAVHMLEREAGRRVDLIAGVAEFLLEFALQSIQQSRIAVLDTTADRGEVQSSSRTLTRNRK